MATKAHKLTLTEKVGKVVAMHGAITLTNHIRAIECIAKYLGALGIGIVIGDDLPISMVCQL